jgi:hypothetical protein
MGRAARFALLMAMTLGLVGCVERRMLIVSDPPGATAIVNGQNIGPTPASIPFTYYGKYDVMLVRDGYQPKTYSAKLYRPWFEFFPIDFFAENLWPGHLQDDRTLQFTLEPQTQPRTEDVMSSADHLRKRAATIQSNPPGGH